MSFPTYGQLNLLEAKKVAEEFKYVSYRYLEEFEGHEGYAAPIIISTDGGALFFTRPNDGNQYDLVKINKEGKKEWSIELKAKFDDMESQGIVENSKGNYYAFLLSYNQSRYRGGAERVIYLSRNGEIIWEQLLGDYTLENNPTCSWIRIHSDDQLEMRGHIVTDPELKDRNPEYRFWKGWLNPLGERSDEIGTVIDWSDPVTQTFFEVE